MNTSTTNKSTWYSLIRWIDAYAVPDSDNTTFAKSIDWTRAIPFILLHISVLFVFVVGWSPAAIITAIILYAIRMFAITGFYHRYFSHKAFKTSRFVQFTFAAIGASAVQRGPLWWAAHHRIHHVNSDGDNDEHSPRLHGFLWSHMGWFLSRHNFNTRLERISDFAKYPELRFLDRFDILMPIILATALYIFGELLAKYFPEMGTSGWQMLVWGFVVSTLVLYHITFTINSLAHTIGKRRFNTRDDSRNNWFLALLTFGEGWHNNHHYYPGSARQGFRWWEIDISYYLLYLLKMTGLIWDLRPVPERISYPNHKQRRSHRE
ncbi:MAG: acyl-CoA desaturase [Thioalkalispiraceae bacterium]|jgi:stearoyl-CoA desaturase (delta-9 desaturase)